MAFAAITDPANQPVYVHCHVGKDRTGFMIGLVRKRVDHWKSQDVLKELEKYGHGALRHALFPQIANLLARDTVTCGDQSPH
jgi:protein tyrosine/serine phosphatase